MFDFVVELTSSTSDFLDKVSKEGEKKTHQITSSNGNYTEEVTNTISMQGMCRQLLIKFDLLSKMSHWTPTTPLFLADSKHINIQKYLIKNDDSKTPSAINILDSAFEF